MESTRHAFCIDPQSLSSKPSGEILKKICMRIAGTETTVTLSGLKSAISNGQTYSPYTFKTPLGAEKPRRKEEFFKSMSAVVIDVDKGASNIEELSDKIDNLGLNFSLIHKTFSWTTETPKFRLIILMEQPETEPIRAKALNLSFKNIFQELYDSACVDLSRIFFGGKADSVIYESDFILTKNKTEELLEPFIPEVRIQNKRFFPTGNYAKDYDAPKVNDPDFIKNELEKLAVIWGEHEVGHFFLLKLKEEDNYIRKYNGSFSSRYMVLFNSARVLGSVKEYSECLIHMILQNAVASNKYFNNYDKDIDSIIKAGILYGRDNASDEVIIDLGRKVKDKEKMYGFIQGVSYPGGVSTVYKYQ